MRNPVEGDTVIMGDHATVREIAEVLGSTVGGAAQSGEWAVRVCGNPRIYFIDPAEYAVGPRWVAGGEDFDGRYAAEHSPRWSVSPERHETPEGSMIVVEDSAGDTVAMVSTMREDADALAAWIAAHPMPRGGASAPSRSGWSHANCGGAVDCHICAQGDEGGAS